MNHKKAVGVGLLLFTNSEQALEPRRKLFVAAQSRRGFAIINAVRGAVDASKLLLLQLLLPMLEGGKCFQADKTCAFCASNWD